MTGSVFASVHAFFHSGTWVAIWEGAGAFGAAVWLATVFWVWKDARRRIEHPPLVGLATLLGAAPPFLGPFLYMLFRPPEYLEDVRERELEIEAIEKRLAERAQACGVCGGELQADFLVCPVCTTRVREACGSCGRPLEPTWQVCPYCETPAAAAPVPLATATATPIAAAAPKAIAAAKRQPRRATRTSG